METELALAPLSAVPEAQAVIEPIGLRVLAGAEPDWTAGTRRRSVSSLRHRPCGYWRSLPLPRAAGTLGKTCEMRWWMVLAGRRGEGSVLTRHLRRGNITPRRHAERRR